MITPPMGHRVWLAGGATDMRKGFDGLAALVQEKLRHDPFGGQIYVFRGRRGGLRRSPLPDFFIGAHAAVRGYELLTRDPVRYRTYFPRLKLIAPN